MRQLEGAARNSGGLSAASVHFEVRVLAQLVDADEHAAMARGRAHLGATVIAPSPDRCDVRSEIFG